MRSSLVQVWSWVRTRSVPGGAELPLGGRLEDNGELPGEVARIAGGEVVAQPPHGLGVPVLAPQDEGEEQGRLGLIAPVGLGDGPLGHVLVVARPRGQRHQRRREPVPGGLDHELFADLAGGGLRDVADVEGLKQPDAGAAHHLVVPVLALQVGLEGAQLGLGALHGGGPPRLLDVLGELPLQLGQLVLGRPERAGDLRDHGADLVDVAPRRHGALDLVELTRDRRQVQGS